MRKFANEWAIVDVIDPDVHTAATYLSAEIDFSEWLELVAIVMAGTLGTNATVDAAFHTSATAGGSYAAVSGKAITQLTEAGTDSDKQAIIHLRPDEVGGKRYVKLSAAIGTATSDFGAIILGKPRYAPGTDQDDASVDEVVY